VRKHSDRKIRKNKFSRLFGVYDALVDPSNDDDGDGANQKCPCYAPPCLVDITFDDDLTCRIEMKGTTVKKDIKKRTESSSEQKSPMIMQCLEPKKA
jgi:hypothetical protein